MQNVLLNHPMPNTEFNQVVSPQILRLLKERKSKDQILEMTNLTENQFFANIESLIQTGQPVQKTDIAYISNIDFKLFRKCFDTNSYDITNNSKAEIVEKYFNESNQRIDIRFARLALLYYAVRVHLDRTDVPFIDSEDDVLVHPEKLIMPEREDRLNTTYETDRHYPPYRRHNAVPTFIDFLFGGQHNYYDYDDDVESDEYHMDYDLSDEYEGYDLTDEYEGSVDGDETNASDDVETEGEAIEVSDESEEESHDESDNEGSHEEIHEESHEEQNGTDDESESVNVGGCYSRKRQRME